MTYLITVTNRGAGLGERRRGGQIAMPPSITEVGSVLTSRGAFDPGGHRGVDDRLDTAGATRSRRCR